MIKSRKSFKQASEITDVIPYSYKTRFITSKSVIEEIKDFLNRYMKGSCEYNLSTDSYKSLGFAPDGLAYVLKLLFKAVRSREIIALTSADFDEFLRLRAEFNTELLTDEIIQAISDVSEKSKIKVEIYKTHVDIDIFVWHGKMPLLHSLTAKLLFASLVSIFFDIPDANDDDISPHIT